MSWRKVCWYCASIYISTVARRPSSSLTSTMCPWTKPGILATTTRWPSWSATSTAGRWRAMAASSSRWWPERHHPQFHTGGEAGHQAEAGAAGKWRARHEEGKPGTDLSESVQQYGQPVERALHDRRSSIPTAGAGLKRQKKSPWGTQGWRRGAGKLWRR